MITKGDSNARSVWRVSIGLKDGSPVAHGEKIKIEDPLQPDQEYRTRIENHYRSVLKEKAPFLDQKIGTAGVCLDGTEETVRNKESNWGNYLVDLMRTAIPNLKADVAILNSGTIRIDDKVCGDIRFEHLLRTFAFPTNVAYVKVTGKYLEDRILEHAVSEKPGDGRFLQVSGIRFTFDRRRNGYDRVTDVKVQTDDGWKDLQKDRIYIVAIPGYLYGGGDGYFQDKVKEFNSQLEGFRKNRVDSVLPGPDLMYIAFRELTLALSKNEPVARQIEGRIVEIR
jgi:2',3'-cyclic-nucleotide 2'-phosphodiesterase (5'-nucleotidase family)